MVLPVTTATVERSFSDMKLIKTRLRSRLGEETLNHTMRISIEGPDKLISENLDSIIQLLEGEKKSKTNDIGTKALLAKKVVTIF